VSAEKKTDFHVVNHSIPRRDGRVKVTGKAQYVADLKLIGMAYAKVLRSPFAHAKIISIDKSRAEAHAGVYCVVTGYDLDGLNPYFGHAVKDHPLLAIDKVRYAGEPVAAVVAVDERTAFEALEFIDVKYQELRASSLRNKRWPRTRRCCTKEISKPARCADSKAMSPPAKGPISARPIESSGATSKRHSKKPLRSWRAIIIFP